MKEEEENNYPSSHHNYPSNQQDISLQDHNNNGFMGGVGEYETNKRKNPVKFDHHIPSSPSFNQNQPNQYQQNQSSNNQNQSSNNQQLNNQHNNQHSNQEEHHHIRSGDLPPGFVMGPLGVPVRQTIEAGDRSIQKHFHQSPDKSKIVFSPTSHHKENKNDSIQLSHNEVGHTSNGFSTPPPHNNTTSPSNNKEEEYDVRFYKYF